MVVTPRVHRAGGRQRGKRSADGNAGPEIRQVARRLADAEETVAAAVAVGDEPHGVSAKSAEMWINYSDGGADGDCRLDRVAAGLEHAQSRPGRKGVRTRRHSPSTDRQHLAPHSACRERPAADFILRTG